MDKTPMSGREQWQYTLATLLIASGIAIAFISFFLNNHDIADGVLTYIAQAFIAGGSLLGVSIYVRGKLSDFKQHITDALDSHARNSDKGVGG